MQTLSAADPERYRMKNQYPKSPEPGIIDYFEILLRIHAVPAGATLTSPPRKMYFLTISSFESRSLPAA
jgi:hypothetical protein